MERTNGVECYTRCTSITVHPNTGVMIGPRGVGLAERARVLWGFSVGIYPPDKR